MKLKKLLLEVNTMDNSKQNNLAYELATTLNDKEALPVYEAFVWKYNEEFLRKTLARVMSIPDSKIKRSRGALFTFLVQQNGKLGNNTRN